MNENLNNLPSLNGEPSLSSQSAVDNASIANCMNKNKESLKVKLLLRRPINVLVDQGILPPPKSSPAFYEQKLKLERAKTGDFLKHKIQRRPQRDELVQQHILEDTFDPSYYEQERKLKKARLADDLNQRLSHRPGPLELIKGNILHTDETFEQAIKEGQITFKKTCEGEIVTNPPKRFVFEEESSSDSAPSPLQSVKSPTSLTNQQSSSSTSYQFINSSFVISNNNLISTTQPADSSSIAIPTSTPLNANLSYILTPSVTNTCILSSNTSPVVKLNTKCLNVARSSSNNSALSASGRSIDFKNFGPNKNFHSFNNSSQTINQKSKKKVKSKNQPKTRIIKFHEYTGPPNVKKLSNSSQSDAETSYELLLKQQQLFLQWQLECQQKFSDLTYQNNKCEKPEMPLVDTKSKLLDNKLVNNEFKNEDNTVSNPGLLTNYQLKTNKSNSQHEVQDNSAENIQNKLNDLQTCANSVILKQFPQIVKTNISKFENMKVTDLKAELKKRNLPVSGPKQQLIERLKPFTDFAVSDKNEQDNKEGKETVKSNQLSNQDIVNNNSEFKPNNNSNATAIGDPLSNNSSTFILNSNITPNNISKNNVKLNEEFVLVTNGSDNNFQSIPLQLKQNSTINLDAPTLTIPIANGLNTFIPQYQIVSSTPTDNKINLNGLNIATPNTIQSQLAASNIMLNNKLNIINSPQNIISTNLNFNQATGQMDKNPNLTILTGSPIQLGSIKNNLSFNIAQPMPNIGNKLVSIQNSGPVFHQFLLYPTMIGTQPDISNIAPKQRSNSLPGETLHQLQRNASFPFIINNKLASPLAENMNSKNVNTNKVKLDLNSKNVTQKVENVNSKITFNNVNTSTDVSFKNSIKTATQKCDAAKNNKNSLNKSNGLFDIKESVYEEKMTAYVDSTNSNNKKGSNSLELTTAPAENSPSLEIQPDSTTNSNTLDLDFIINFDELNDDMNESNVGNADSSRSMEKIVNDEPIQAEIKNDDKSKNNCMIDFSDNWFEMTFGDASTDHVQANDITNEDSNKQADNSNIDTNLLETINQLFDQNYSINDIKNNNYMSEDNNSKTMIFTKHDPVMSNNDTTSSVHVNSSGESNSGNSHSYNSNHASNAVSASNSAYNNLKYNCFNNSSNLFNVDPFSEYFFEDADIKNSMDFSMC